MFGMKPTLVVHKGKQTIKVAVDPSIGFGDAAPDSAAKVVVEVECDVCGKMCKSAQGLVQHKRSHVAGAQPKTKILPDALQVQQVIGSVVDEVVARTDPLQYATEVVASLVNKTVETLEREKQANARAAALNQERVARQHQRDTSAEPAGLRCGSKKRASYTPVQKLNALEVYDRIRKDPAISNKALAWEEETGISQNNIKGKTGWAEPVERAKICAAAGDVLRKSLLRINKQGRYKGKYDDMEQDLYQRLIARRKKARRVSPRWLSHTARWLMKVRYSEAAKRRLAAGMTPLPSPTHVLWTYVTAGGEKKEQLYDVGASVFNSRLGVNGTLICKGSGSRPGEGTCVSYYLSKRGAGAREVPEGTAGAIHMYRGSSNDLQIRVPAWGRDIWCAAKDVCGITTETTADDTAPAAAASPARRHRPADTDAAGSPDGPLRRSPRQPANQPPAAEPPAAPPPVAETPAETFEWVFKGRENDQAPLTQTAKLNSIVEDVGLTPESGLPPRGLLKGKGAPIGQTETLVIVYTAGELKGEEMTRNAGYIRLVQPVGAAEPTDVAQAVAAPAAVAAPPVTPGEAIAADLDGFKGGHKWRGRFMKRWKLSKRKKTCRKNHDPEKRLEIHQRHCKRMRTLMKAGNPQDPKWGRYLPWQRFNVDQVPLPFVNEMEDTIEQRGAKRVHINQHGSSLHKRQCTAQLCIRPEAPPLPDDASDEQRAAYQPQPRQAIIWRGGGVRVSEAEKAARSQDIDHYFQPKAWCDRQLAMSWSKQTFHQVIEADIKAGIATHDTRNLLFQDNLDAQIQQAYRDDMDTNNQTSTCDLTPNYTEDEQPIDDGFGRLVKQYIGEALDEWLDDDSNLERWEGSSLTASERRILLSHWFAAAVKKAFQKTRALRAYFEHTGCLMTIDGSEDHLIKLEGMSRKEGEKFQFDDVELPREAPVPAAPEPEDEAPERDDQEFDNEEDRTLDEEDDEEMDETDAPPAPFNVPAGFRLSVDQPTAEQLEFKNAAGEQLVGKFIMFNWVAAGWCVGEVTHTNTDGRRTVEKGVPANFFVYYEIDDDESKHALSLNEYGQMDPPGGWVLLEVDKQLT